MRQCSCRTVCVVSQILVGSHRAGRVDHVAKGNQAGAEEERVELLSRKLPLLYAELGEGDAIFFHCNILHRSDKNTSPNRRWGFLVAYNTSDNSPVYSDCHFSATYRKMEKVRTLGYNSRYSVQHPEPALRGPKPPRGIDHFGSSSAARLGNKIIWYGLSVSWGVGYTVLVAGFLLIE